MSTLTLPHVAMLLLGDVAYPMRSLVDGNPLAAFAPVLPDGFRWADDEEVLPDHVILDQPTLTALLFCSDLEDGGEPDEDELLTAIDATLAVYGCHVDRCGWRHVQEADTAPEHTARRYAWCIRCTARLLHVEA